MKKKTAPKKAPAKKAAIKAAPKPKPVLRPQLGLDPKDQHGPMRIPSHKPTPAYAGMSQNKWAGKPPRHNIPIPKK